MGAVNSDSTTGNYTLNVGTTLPVTVVAKPAAGEALNALVLEGVVPS